MVDFLFVCLQIPSEGSGAVTDASSPYAVSSSTSIDQSTYGSSIAGELSDIIVKGAMSKKHGDNGHQAESLLKFSQSVHEHAPADFQPRGKPVGNEIEVSFVTLSSLSSFYSFLSLLSLVSLLRTPLSHSACNCRCRCLCILVATPPMTT